LGKLQERRDAGDGAGELAAPGRTPREMRFTAKALAAWQPAVADARQLLRWLAGRKPGPFNHA
jgi:hypothetical protein